MSQRKIALGGRDGEKAKNHCSKRFITHAAPVFSLKGVIVKVEEQVKWNCSQKIPHLYFRSALISYIKVEMTSSAFFWTKTDAFWSFSCDVDWISAVRLFCPFQIIWANVSLWSTNGLCSQFHFYQLRLHFLSGWSDPHILYMANKIQCLWGASFMCFQLLSMPSLLDTLNAQKVSVLNIINAMQLLSGLSYRNVATNFVTALILFTWQWRLVQQSNL